MSSASLQISTAWRLTKAGVMSQAVLMNGPAGGRLVIIENLRVVEWKRYDRVAELHRQAGAAFEARRRAGWETDPC